MQALARITVLLGLLVFPGVMGGPREAGGAQPDADDRDRAVAIVTAMLINDASLRTMEWTQHESVPRVPYDLSSPRVPFSEARFAWDARGPFAMDVHLEWWSDPNINGPASQMGSLYRFDGEFLRARPSDSPREGLLRAEENERDLLTSPLLLLGRREDPLRLRLLGEMLLDAPSLRLSHDDSGDGLVGVHASMAPHGQWVRYELEIDTRRGFVPVAVRQFHIAWGYLMEEWVVTRVEQVSGVWIPVGAVRSSYLLALDDAFHRAIRAAREAEGLADSFDWKLPENHERWHRVVERAFGRDGPPTRPYPIGPSFLVVDRVHAVNERLEPERFLLTWPRDASVMNGFTHGPAIIDGAGRVWATPEDALRAGAVPIGFADGLTGAGGFE